MPRVFKEWSCGTSGTGDGLTEADVLALAVKPDYEAAEGDAAGILNKPDLTQSETYNVDKAAAGEYVQGVSQILWNGYQYILNTDAVLQAARGNTDTVDQTVLPSTGDGRESGDWIPVESLSVERVVRPEEFGGTDAASVLAALTYLDSKGGGVLKLGIAEYASPFAPPVGDGYFDEPPTMVFDNITISGDRLPTTNAGMTALIDGSIIKGSWFYAANNFNWDNIGIDVGADWCATNNAGSAQEGLISINRANAGYAGYSAGDPQRIGGKDCGDLIVLCKGTGRPAGYWGTGDLGDESDVHAVLLENVPETTCRGVIRTIYSGAGIVLKSSRCRFIGGWKVERCFKYGAGLIKSEDYSAANDNYIVVLRGQNHITDLVVDQTDKANYEQSSFSVEAATADCTGNILLHHGAYAPINGVDFNALINQVCEKNTVHMLGSFDDCFSYPVLTRGSGLCRRNTVINLRGDSPLAGAFISTDDELTLVAPDIVDARQYSYRAEAGATLELTSPTSKTDGFGHFYTASAASTISIIGGVNLSGSAQSIVGVGVVTGSENNPSVSFVGPNIFENGDCESTEVFTPIGSALAVVSGGVVGNALEILRDTAAAGYATKQLSVVPGSTYRLLLSYKNGTGTGRIFVGSSTFASGEYTSNSFDTISNANWTQYDLEFTATSNILFVTVQIASATGANFLLDEISLKTVLPRFADNATAIAAGLTNGSTYITTTDPALLAIVQ